MIVILQPQVDDDVIVGVGGISLDSPAALPPVPLQPVLATPEVPQTPELSGPINRIMAVRERTANEVSEKLFRL